MAIWLLVFGVATVLVRAGLTLVVGGAARPREAADALLRAGAETAAAVLAFWAIGAPLLLGRHHPLLAFDPGLVLSQSPDSAATEFFHAVVATIGGAVVAGAVLGRARFHVSVVAAAVLGGVVFPVVGHLVWFGYLRQLNVIDFGGATAVHLTAAVFAAVGVAAVGSRPGHYAGGVAVAPRPVEDLPLMAAGVGLVAVGWFPYLLACVLAHGTDLNPMDSPAVAGRALAWAAMNVALAAAGGVAGGLAYGRARYGRADLASAATGLLGGLVAISAAAFAVDNLGAVMIGAVAGGLVPAAAGFMDRRARLDDPAGLIAVHGVGAVWGLIAAALLAAGQSTIAHFQLLAVQSLAVAVTVVVAAAAAAATFALLRMAGPTRADTAPRL